MADQRTTTIKKDEVQQAVRNRKIRLFGGVAVGIACLALAFVTQENVIGLMLIAMVAFGVETLKSIASIWAK